MCCLSAVGTGAGAAPRGSRRTIRREQLLHVEPSAHGQFHVAVVLLVSLDGVVLRHSASIAFLNSSNDS